MPVISDRLPAEDISVDIVVLNLFPSYENIFSCHAGLNETGFVSEHVRADRWM